MTPEKWRTIKDDVQKQFGIEEQGREDLFVETAEGRVKQGEAEFLIFEGPAAFGRMKLELLKKPKLEEKKYHYSHRQGTAARVEYKFSEKEMVYSLKAYKWNETDENWREIDSSSFG